jgi:beta-lactamase regulating signal transducer with metallopeptidase domain
MNDYGVTLPLLDAVARVAGLGLNWLVQSSLLLAVGLSAGWLLRRRGPVAQSLICRTTLAAVLICPVISWALAQAGVGGWSISVVAAWTVSHGSAPVRIEPADSAGGGQPGGRAIDLSPPPIVSPEAVAPVSHVRSASATDPAHSQTAGSDTHSAWAMRRSVSSSEQEPEVAGTTLPMRTERTSTLRPFHVIVYLVTLFWVCGAAILLVRLANGWRKLWCLCASATEPDPATVATCQEVACLMHVAVPEVKHSPFLSSPCLAGVHRPVVLLPESLSGDELRNVLIHELAHLSRRDAQWHLLSRLTTAVFFVQPLLWELARWLELAAEEVCDDHVLHLGTDRRAYARLLADIAERASNHFVAAGVGVVSRPSILARRVGRILDPSRPLSIRSSRLLRVMVLVSGIVFTGGAGLIGVAQRSVASASDAGITSEEAVGQVVETSEDVSEPAVRIRGQVVGPEDQPVAGARIAVIGLKQRLVPRVSLSLPPTEVLAETITDSLGIYQISLPRRILRAYARAEVLASAPGTGLAWQTLDLEARQVDMPLVLPAEQPIRGRLLDTEGRPAAGVRVLTCLIRASKSGSDGPILFPVVGTPPAAWPQPVTTDEQGRFTIANVPASYGVWLVSEGTDRFARHELVLNFEFNFHENDRDTSFRVQVKSIGPDEEAVFQVQPARIFTGIVRYEDTRQPSPGTRLTIYSLQPFQSPSNSVEGSTDSQGRFRLSPVPGDQFAFWAVPPDGTPYLIRRLQSIAWTEDDREKQIDVTLPRGVLLRGTVVEADSGAVVAEALVRYVAEQANNPDHADDILPEQTVSGPDGRFEIAVLPGPGRLLVDGPTSQYVLQEIGSQQLSHGHSGGQREYSHAVREIDPERGSEPAGMKIELQRGSSVTVHLTDEAGETADGVRVISRLNVRPENRYNRFLATASGGHFQFSGLADSQLYPVYFLDAEHQRGASAILEAGDQMRQVMLTACGQATATLIDSAGNRLARFRPRMIEMIVTPGVPAYDADAILRGELAADAVDLSRIDRASYEPGPQTDEQGRITFPALIPGATYRLTGTFGGSRVVVREFTARPGETISLGEIVIRR